MDDSEKEIARRGFSALNAVRLMFIENVDIHTGEIRAPGQEVIRGNESYLVINGILPESAAAAALPQRLSGFATKS